METIGSQKIWSFFDRRGCQVTKNTAIRQGPGHPVESYFELATKIAELQFLNRDHVLLFRGQRSDHGTSSTTRRSSRHCFVPRAEEKIRTGPRWSSGSRRLSARKRS
jgi:hypothetical protein